LTVGQLVATPVGPVDVLSVTTQQQAGEGLYNLWLDPGPAGSTFMLANGIVVGDYQMQVALLNQTRTDPELVRASLPAHLHRDFDSYLEDLAAYQ
jgi:hypothetical protein